MSLLWGEGGGLQKPYKFLELKKKEIIFGTKLYLNRENLKIVYNEYANYD